MLSQRGLEPTNVENEEGDIFTFQSPISGVNDWNMQRAAIIGNIKRFQSPISGVNDWNSLNMFV